MILTYLIVAFNAVGAIAVVALTWACVHGAKMERAMKLRAQRADISQ